MRARWERLSLWPRLVIAVTVGFVVLFAVFSALAVRAVDESTKRITHERLVIATMAAGEIERVLERARRALVAAAATDAPQAGAPAELAQAYATQAPTALAVYAVDASGRALRAEPPQRLAAAKVVVRRVLVARALAARRAVLSEPFRDISGRPAVALAHPVGARGSLQTVLVAVLDVSSPAFTKPLAQARTLEQSGHAELVGPRGIRLVTTDDDEALEPGEHFPFYLRMLASRESAVESVPYTPPNGPAPEHADQHVMAWAPVAHAPWGVTVGANEAHTFAPVDRLRRTLLLAGFGALAMLWVVALVGARLLVRPVQTLTGAARAMALGDLARPIAVREGGEIGALARSLESMRAQLRESIETVRRWGQELEAKVEERTAELRSSNRQLAAVTAVATAGSRARDLPSMVDPCLAAILEHTHMDGAALRLVDERERRLGPAFCRGVMADFACSSRAIDAGECPCGDGIDGTTLYVRGDARCGSCGPGAHMTLAILPLKTRRKVIGVLAVARDAQLPLSREEGRTLAAIGDQLAVAVENARLVDELGQIETQREVQRMKTELIASVSHELRTPLGFVKGYATTLLRDDAIEPETRRQFLEIIDDEATKLAGMVEELLDASRLQAGRLEIVQARVELRTLVEEVVEKARPTLAAARHTVTVDGDGGPVHVTADPLRVEQILGNLLENAARYSEPDTPIVVEVRADDGRGVVAVRDHGPGVAADELERVFEPFYRGAASSRRSERGVGLGLAICRGLVEAQGGQIWVESVPGVGATFLFALRVDAPAPARPRPAAQADGADPT